MAQPRMAGVPGQGLPDVPPIGGYGPKPGPPPVGPPMGQPMQGGPPMGTANAMWPGPPMPMGTGPPMPMGTGPPMGGGFYPPQGYGPPPMATAAVQAAGQVPMATATVQTPGPCGPGPCPPRGGPGFQPVATTVTYGGPQRPPMQGPPMVPMATAAIQTGPPPRPRQEVPMATATAVVKVQEQQRLVEKVPVPVEVEVPVPVPVPVETRKPSNVTTTVIREVAPPVVTHTRVTEVGTYSRDVGSYSRDVGSYSRGVEPYRPPAPAPTQPVSACAPTQILPQEPPAATMPTKVFQQQPVGTISAMPTADLSAKLKKLGCTFLHFRTDPATVSVLKREPTTSSSPNVFLPDEVYENELVELLEVLTVDGHGFGKVRTKEYREGWLQIKHLRAVPRSSLCWHQRKSDGCEATILKEIPGVQGPSHVQASTQPTVNNGDIVEILKFTEAGDFAEVVKHNAPHIKGWIQTSHLQFPGTGGNAVPLGTAFQTMPRAPASQQ
mmetsp:Transcript_51880/g.121346  ORF Transcript_51880/g.121346 Transcript_51880/m.121346 type:complete len:495 (+) Transcript_51880:71-1555(+)